MKKQRQEWLFNIKVELLKYNNEVEMKACTCSNGEMFNKC